MTREVIEEEKVEEVKRLIERECKVIQVRTPIGVEVVDDLSETASLTDVVGLRFKSFDLGLFKSIIQKVPHIRLLSFATSKCVETQPASTTGPS